MKVVLPAPRKPETIYTLIIKGHLFLTFIFYNIFTLISFKKEKELSINISNDSDLDSTYKLNYSYFDIDGNILKTDSGVYHVNKYSSSDILSIPEMKEAIGVYASISIRDEIVSDNYYFFNKDKDIAYKSAKISLLKNDNKELVISADTLARAVCINVPNGVVLSDNYFNLLKGETKTIRCSKEVNIDDIKIVCLNNIY